MRTDELIQQLSTDLPPVRPLARLPVRLAGWAVISATSFAVVLVLMGVRRELGDVLDRADFAFEAALLLLTAISAAVGALTMSVPGDARSVLVKWLPVGAALACVLWALGELAFASATGAPTGRVTFAWHCVYKTASIAVVPSVALFALLRRAAPLDGAWSGLLALLATAAVGVLGANTICPTDRPMHMLLWHVLPLVLFGGVGAGLGTWLLRLK